MALGICELMWIKTLLKELQVEIQEPMKLFCDNKVAFSIVHNLVQRDKTKHFKIDKHFIKEKIKVGIVCTPYIPTKLQLADMFTKVMFGFQKVLRKEKKC